MRMECVSSALHKHTLSLSVSLWANIYRGMHQASVWSPTTDDSGGQNTESCKTSTVAGQSLWKWSIYTTRLTGSVKLHQSSLHSNRIKSGQCCILLPTVTFNSICYLVFLGNYFFYSVYQPEFYIISECDLYTDPTNLNTLFYSVQCSSHMHNYMQPTLNRT